MKKLTIEDIEIPGGMRRAFAAEFGLSDIDWAPALAAALLWLSEHPIVPSEEEFDPVFKESYRSGQPPTEDARKATIEWQRIMFPRKPDALPDEVKKLLYFDCEVGAGIVKDGTFDNANQRITAAYKLGLERAK